MNVSLYTLVAPKSISDCKQYVYYTLELPIMQPYRTDLTTMLL